MYTCDMVNGTFYIESVTCLPFKGMEYDIVTQALTDMSGLISFADYRVFPVYYRGLASFLCLLTLITYSFLKQLQ